MKVLIVEDEIIISDDICMTLEEHDYEVTGQAIDYDDAIQSFIESKPDLVLLDINLSGEKDGIQVAEKIIDLGRVPFIYTSSLGDSVTIARAKGTNPDAYLLKPFKEEQLLASIEIALSNFSNTQDSEKNELAMYNNAIFVKDKHRFVKVLVNEILYISKSDNYIDLYTHSKKYVIRASMGSFLEQLKSEKMYKTNRSFAVNINHITDLSTTIVRIGDIEIPITKSNARSLLERLNSFR